MTHEVMSHEGLALASAFDKKMIALREEQVDCK